MNRILQPRVFGLAVLLPLFVAVAASLIFLGEAPKGAQYPAVLAISYLLGSIPWGYMLLRWRMGVDVREYGSGTTGTTNVLRTGGGGAAAVVLSLDVVKGLLAVVLARVIIEDTAAEMAAGLVALVGHNWPVFLQFKGGRGILTGLGGLWIMAPIVAAVAAVSFVLITLVSRYVSLGNILGVFIAAWTMLALALIGVYSNVYTLYVFVGGSIIIWQHRDNIRRIRQGNERRLGQPATKVG